MSIWIVTTGNSDVLLKKDKNWGSLYSEVRYNLECTEFASPTQKDTYNKEAGYTVPARVLGLVYENKPDYYESDLEFPLLDTYYQYFVEQSIKPERIIILLTDQSQIFNQDKLIYEKCPYWQDTCTLKPLLEWYLQRKFDCQLEFLYLAPKNDNNGIDNWNETLSLVEEAFCKLDFNPLKPVYVSHQAGTPAISSAIQFVSLGRFQKVKFLVSNEYFDENYEHQSKSEAIESSNYWRGMQIQKAKQLIIKGLPAAAKEILTDIVDDEVMDEINKVVDLFNIKSSFPKGQEFEAKSAVSRIVISLDLIEIFFNQENYIQGIALLNATQETFLKPAIISQKRKNNDSLLNLSSIVDWDRDGLFIKSQNNLSQLNIPQNITLFLKSLNFPIPVYNEYDFPFWEKYQKESHRRFKLNNTRQFKWLCELKQDFKPWEVLSWSCQYQREREDDLRNQLLHNLLGVDKTELLDYILGYNKGSIKVFLGDIQQKTDESSKKINEVEVAYQQNVKSKFLKSLKLFGLSQETTIENKLQIKLRQIADHIN
ncbi:hypothetical protein [Nostoc sp. NMS9]|uniref:hypothetical protein n=1 Tax=Nostoc sp. NMS9 TaxID=2815393 RepID=UPI0025E68F41|nr:hypothetical protein [Nostoc sp. NMS9]MBN3944620.1 hypothetical protein [Nostoc sp. NMS9]